MVILFLSLQAIYSNTHGVKVELIQQDGKIINIVFKKIKGYRYLEPAQIKDLTQMIDKYANAIIEYWIDYFVSGKTNITSKKITKL
jgi:hypothetical protein